MIDIPEELAHAQEKFNGAKGRAFIAGLPRLTAAFLDRWKLRVTGAPMHGVSALVLPVDRADGTPAVLKLQIRDEEMHLDRARALAWTRARLLENIIWNIEDGDPVEQEHLEIARRLGRRG
ncbi:hypothetical protein GCM10009535_54920 [Streptomyces thermocarboxydovorans]|uniref:DUF559 domain-containing protein n=1 Tax=Streptomyces thermocarboxydovorans TaxID=59298 RepID=A0ABN1HUF9_9ACTN